MVQNSSSLIDPRLVTGGVGRIAQRAASNSEWILLLTTFFVYLLNRGAVIGVPFIDKLKFEIPQLIFFNGINFMTLIKSGLISDIAISVLLNTSFWVIVIFFFVSRRGHNFEETLSFYLMVIAFALTLGFNGILNINDLTKNVIGSFIHILLIIFIRNWILVKKYDQIQANYYTLFILFFDFYSFNLISTFFPGGNLDMINRMIFPVLVLSVLLLMDESNLKNFLIFGVLFFYVTIFIVNTASVRADFSQQVSQEEIESSKSALDKFTDRIKLLWTSYNESQQLIQGNYYTGQVDDYENEPLGVFIEDVEPSDNEYSVGETITVWGTLKAYTIDNENKDNKINIHVTCTAIHNNKPINGTIKPRSDFKVESFDEEFLTCTIPKEKVNESGHYQIIFNATFNFKTQSYLKTYYIEKERKRVLKSENIDFFTEYGINDRNPVARYTNGPLGIGMGTTPPPIGVPQDNKDFSSYIGITLNNNWDGKMVKLNNLVITVPDGLWFDDDSCEYFNHFTGGTLNDWTLNKEIRDLKNEKKFELPHSYKCSLALRNQQTLLGNTPVSIQYFSTMVDYEYQISEKTSINVKKIEEENNT